MLPNHPHRLCKSPETSRLAQLVLAAPIVPISFKADSNRQPYQYDVAPYQITGDGKQIPDKIYRDLLPAASHSVADWLLAASREPSFDEIDQNLFADLRNQLIRFAAAGLNDQVLDTSMQGALMTACSNITRKQSIPEWKNINLLGVDAQAAFKSLQGYATEISNKMIREEQQRGTGRGGGNG